MIIEEYCDMLSVIIIGRSKRKKEEYLTIDECLKKHFHTQEHIEKYILEKYGTTATFKSFSVYMTTDIDNETISIGHFEMFID